MMKFKNFLYLIFIALIIFKIYPVKIDNNIRINQLGYLTNSPKYFIVANSNSTSFNIIDSKKETVYSGKLNDLGFYNESGEKLKIGDFSDFNKIGEYKIIIDKNNESYKFRIGDDIYTNVLNATIKSYYFQRASMSLEKKYADKWYRFEGHPDINLLLHTSTGKSGKYSSPGGWYDAGDYGKYIVNGGISVCTLLGLYELYPDVIRDDLNIPESGNKRSDILDEVKYEIDWMKTMQDIDGGVFFKIAPLRWPGFIQPKDDTAQRYVIGKSTTSTLNFCAAMAQAGRVFKNIDIVYANDCIDRAKRAWDWAIKNPKVTHPSETGGSGSYSDSIYDDEFYWAASELFISTGDNIYKKYLSDNISVYKISKQATWAYVSNLGNFSLSIANNLPEKQINLIKNGIINYSDKLISDINKSGYKIPLKEKDFIWGSNGEICNYGVILCYAYKLTNNKKYLDGVIMILDYIFGKNATGYSFVTGYGSKTPMNIHHRPSGSDNINDPVPGFLVGGPNKDRQDNQQYPGNTPAKSYVDKQDSYASNEICINWNASLVFILGFLEANKEIYIK